MEKLSVAKRQGTIEDLVDELTEKYQQKSAGLNIPAAPVVEEVVEDTKEVEADDWS